MTKDAPEMPDEIWLEIIDEEVVQNSDGGGTHYLRADLVPEREAVDLDINVCSLCGALPCDQVIAYQETIDLDKLITEYSKYRSKEYGLAAVCGSHAKLLRDFGEYLARSGHLLAKAEPLSETYSKLVGQFMAQALRLSDEERAHTQTLEERDHAQDMADKLSSLIDVITGQESGEHSNLNCPWENAIENAEHFIFGPDSVDREAEREQMAAAVLDLAFTPILANFYQSFFEAREKHAAIIDKLRKERG